MGKPALVEPPGLPLVFPTDAQRMTDPSPTLGEQAGVIHPATSPGWPLGRQEDT